MAYPATHPRVATPYQDWQARQPIFWGTTSLPLAPEIDATIATKIRCEAIGANFQTKEPKVITIGPVTPHQREKFSFLSIFHTAIKGAYMERRLLKNIAQIAGIFGAITGMIILDLALYATLSYRVKNHFIKLLVLITPGLGGIGIGISARLIFDKLAENDSPSFFGIFRRLRQINQSSYAWTQNIQQQPSSVGNVDLKTLANNKDGDEWIDPISHDLIPKNEVRAPYYFLIGKYVTRVENVLKIIFNHFDETNHKIRHPIEDRFMTEEEHTKFLKDLCALFSIAEAQLLNLWNDNSIIGIANPLLPKTNDIRSLIRASIFLNLLPEDIKNQHLESVVRKDQLDLFAQLFILIAKSDKWSFYRPKGWIELPFKDDKPISNAMCEFS